MRSWRARLTEKDAATGLTVNDKNLVTLLEATDRQNSVVQCVRDQAVVSVLIFCGLRRQEPLNLTVQSPNLTDHALLVQQGKGNKVTIRLPVR